MPTNPAPSPLPEGQARAALSDAMVASMIRESVDTTDFPEWLTASDARVLGHFYPITTAIHLAWSRAVSPEVRERERREGAREALEKAAVKIVWERSVTSVREASEFIQAMRDREYPALTPPSVTPTCERCGGEMHPSQKQWANHEEEASCIRFLASQVAALAAQVRGAK